MSETIRLIHMAPIEVFLQARGFRRERNRWACRFHEDRHPSCTVRSNRLRCWVCNCWWSAIDLVMKMDGLDLKVAVRQLADFYGVEAKDRPWTPAERRRYARAKAEAAALATRLADFARGLEMTVGRTVTMLSDWLMNQDIDPSEGLAHLHRQLHRLRTVHPQDLASVWRAMPAQAVMLERLGRKDREHAEAITKAVVKVLARSRETHIVGAPTGSPEAA
jgi:CHC2-type zinc finger protein